jgi:hypothetical protein
MGNTLSGEGADGGRNVGRQQAVTEGKRRHRALPPNTARSSAEDWPFIEASWLLVPPSFMHHPANATVT